MTRDQPVTDPPLLVANRGEIARRIIRTLPTSWASRTVAVYSDPDADAPHVARGRRGRAACRAPRRPRRTSHRAARSTPRRRTGADAIHPGYGFLSENADFAQAVVDAGLTWIGPPPAAIAAMGDKLEAKRADARRRRARAAAPS